MKILLAYLCYPISIGRYIREGLQAAGHEVTVMGYTTGDRQAWPGEPRFPGCEDLPNIKISNFSNLYMVEDSVKERMQSGEWDVFINVDAAHHWCGYPLPIPKVVIATDAHCISYQHQRTCCDLFVNMHNAYAREGDHWIPYAYSKEYHYYDETQVVTHDISFVGVPYDLRKRELEALSGVCTVYQSCGEILGDFSKRYSQGWGSYARSSMRDLAARFWEGMATKTLVFVNRVPDLKLIAEWPMPAIEGTHYEGFTTVNELVEKVEYYKKHEVERNLIRNSGYNWVTPHTWETRANELITLIEEKL